MICCSDHPSATRCRGPDSGFASLKRSWTHVTVVVFSLSSQHTIMSSWKPYEPTPRQPWNLQRVVHLHRRCVFGPSWQEVERDASGDPQAAVTRVLEGSCRATGTPEDFDQLSGLIGQAAVGSDNPDRLKAWWVYRFLFSPDPLGERLTLMWHNHFATSNLKVADLSLMKRQNDTLRMHARERFAKIASAIVRDPALLRWLDAPANRKGHANENLARELMELFTLGIGNYSEQDVTEAARALTGWTVRDGEFFESKLAHDAGSKTILGRTGRFRTPELLAILVNHPATARRLARRLADEFCGEDVVDEKALNELAHGLVKQSLDIGWAVETILRSELFFSTGNIASRVCDPVTFLVAPLRATEFWRQESPSTLILAEWLKRLGQDLFYPPNVAGWKGGRAWMTTRTVIARANYVDAVVRGSITSPPSAPEFMFASREVNAAAHRLAMLTFGAANQERIAMLCKHVASERSGRPAMNAAFARLLTEPQAHLH